MIILIFVLFLIITVALIICTKKFDMDSCMFLSIFTGIITVISLIALINISVNFSMSKTAIQRIEMYEEQNNKIESSISDLVTNYMNYESETFKECSSDSSVTLVSLYPELKSDALVEQQCNLYMENNKKIIELKEELINISVYKWWLYFGK